MYCNSPLFNLDVYLVENITAIVARALMHNNLGISSNVLSLKLYAGIGVPLVQTRRWGLLRCGNTGEDAP